LRARGPRGVLVRGRSHPAHVRLPPVSERRLSSLVRPPPPAAQPLASTPGPGHSWRPATHFDAGGAPDGDFSSLQGPRPFLTAALQRPCTAAAEQVSRLAGGSHSDPASGRYGLRQVAMACARSL